MYHVCACVCVVYSCTQESALVYKRFSVLLVLLCVCCVCVCGIFVYTRVQISKMDLLSSPSKVRCPLCSIEVAETDVGSHKISATHLENYKRYTSSVGAVAQVAKPVFVAGAQVGKPGFPLNIRVISDSIFECLWCEKSLQCIEQLEGHLHGKEHSKRCANMDLPMYGEPDHVERVDQFCNIYGTDNKYPRFIHWPEFIEDSDMYWTCTKCVKKFHTQKAVNLHLTEVHPGLSPTHARTPTHAFAHTATPTHAGKPLEKFINQQLRECWLCMQNFDNQQCIDQHQFDLSHIENLYVYNLEPYCPTSN